jgi:glucose/arabinose dehydrogenase
MSQGRQMRVSCICAAAAAAVIGLTRAVLAQSQDVLPNIPTGNIAVSLQPIATGLAAPDYGVSAPGDTNRLFVLEQNGLLRVIQNGSLLPTPALNLQSNVQVAPVGTGPLNPANANDERGLLGLAFNPGFDNPGSVGFRTLYTYTSEALNNPTYPAPAGATQAYQNQITEWKMSATDPNVVDPSTRRVIMSFGKNAGNHNGGTLAYGPDGYLYLATGDGGNANDVGPSHIEPGGNAQNLTAPLGKMLRIDPTLPSLKPLSTDPISANGQYRIPADNPFLSTPGAVPEIYAYGLRNPYRFAFDKGGSHDLILADVGQNTVEEIDRIVKGGNYGWAQKEGTFIFNRTATATQVAGTVQVPNSPGSPAGLIDPISGPGGTLEYDHGDGISITGGFVYRGTAIPQLVGKYVFGDLALVGSPVRINGRLFYADLQDGTIHTLQLPEFSSSDILPNQLTVHGFGEDSSGELYAMVTNTPSNGTGGIVYKIVPFVPEPGSVALLGLGAAAMLGRRRSR